MPQMKQEIAEELARRITAPDFKRTYGIMAEADGYRCPLGVLCDMYMETHPDACWHIGYARFFDADGFTNAQPGHPPVGVREWAGLTEDTCSTIAFLNDIQVPLDKLARWILGDKVVFDPND